MNRQLFRHASIVLADRVVDGTLAVEDGRIATVGPSGAVKAAGIDPKKHEISDWGQCMMSAGKRIVFPGSDAETQLELPFKVGVAIAP